MKYLFYFLIAAILSCSNGQVQSIGIQSENKITSDTLLSDSLCENNAFPSKELKPGYFFKIDSLNSKNYKISWGKDKMVFTTKKIFEVLGSGTLEYLTSNDSAIILSQVCGTSCTYFVVLPINDDKEKIYYEPKAIDLKRNLVAYVPNEFNSSESSAFIVVENFLSGKKTEIRETNLCPAANKGDCIDCSYFKDDNFILRWQGSQWSDKNKDIQQKTFKIDL